MTVPNGAGVIALQHSIRSLNEDSNVSPSWTSITIFIIAILLICVGLISMIPQVFK